MKVAILFSGGKDSTMALYYALKEEEDVKYLLSMKSVNDESYMFHVPNIHITDLLAEALDIPIISAVTQGVKEEELEVKVWVLKPYTPGHFILFIKNPESKDWGMKLA